MGDGRYLVVESKGEDRWSNDDSKEKRNLGGKIAIVTGANRGIGYEVARALARKRATVILACRNKDKGKAAAGRIGQEYPESKAELGQLDLSDLASVRRFADEFTRHYDRLDILINNAGIMATPFGKTADGFELQFGTNYLGYFALTGLLLDPIIHTSQARVITVSSGGHRFVEIDFDNLNAEKGYDRQQAYAQSKLANLLFAYELQRQFEGAGVDTIAAAAHPGWTATNLAVHWWMVRVLNRFIGQKPKMGALPTLYAATAPDVQGGDYYGPGGWQELGGYPTKVQSSASSHDTVVAAKLWAVSEELTGVRYHWPVRNKHGKDDRV
ncbi:MAG: SDR family NAD(P)-dependent oxidoreductase [Thermoflexales bacterium]|nr:SDR family NAD(P)-dependent oxidoreductase [Thermoflexales bacterium]